MIMVDDGLARTDSLKPVGHTIANSKGFQDDCRQIPDFLDLSELKRTLGFRIACTSSSINFLSID